MSQRQRSKHLFLFSLFLTLPFLAYNQATQSEDYKQYQKLSYAEIDSLVMIPYQNGDFDQCLLLMQVGRDKAKKEFGDLDTLYAAYTSTLGFLYSEIGQYEKALPLYIESKNIRERVLGVEHSDFGASVNSLALLHKSMGNYELALPLFIQSKNISEKVSGKEHLNFANTLNNLALLYEDMGNYELALPLYIQSKNISEKLQGIEHLDFAYSLNNLAGLHESMENYELALPLYIQSKNIMEKVLGSEHPAFATSLNNLAYLHKKMGNYELALPLYTQSKKIREKVLGVEHPSFANSLNNLATLHEIMGNYELALPLYIQSKSIREKMLGVEHPASAVSLNNLAALHERMGNYDLALPLYIQSKNVYEKVLGMEHPYLANTLNNLAVLYQKMGDFESAWGIARQTMNSMSSLKLNHSFNKNWADSLKLAPFPSNDHINQMVTSLEIAYQLLEKDSSIIDARTKQINTADLATALLERARNQASNENDKLRFLEQSNDWLISSLTILSHQEHTAKAFNLSDKNKSVLLLQATKSEATYQLGGLPDSLVVQDKKLLKKQSQLEANLLENRSKEEKDSLRNELNHVNQDIGNFVEMIKKKYPKYHQLKYQQVDAKVEDIQALLSQTPNSLGGDNHTALLEYVIGDSVVHIFWVDKKQVQWEKSFVGNKELMDRIKTLHESLSDYELVAKDKEKAYRNYTENAYWFYQKLLAPVLSKTPNSLGEKDKQNIKNFIVVSDGELGHLPFETFLVEQASQSITDYNLLHYLVNDYNVSYNYSATLWKENKETPTPKNNGQILGMAANYDIKLDSSMTNTRLPTDQWLRATLMPLPAARKEVETLQEKYQGFFAFDALASEKTVKEKAGDFAIIHLAMHGMLDAKRPMLSSLAFTEDNDNLESNFWQAHEISKMELNANLVVLSACETGYGRFEKGNGIASLSRAFMYAGASALIVSLWQVNDYATSEIMKNLYENLANGMKKDEALRHAKIQYMKVAHGIAAHPAFWSPFILMGNTDAIYLKTKGNWFWWVTGACGLGLGGCLWAMRRKRPV